MSVSWVARTSVVELCYRRSSLRMSLYWMLAEMFAVVLHNSIIPVRRVVHLNPYDGPSLRAPRPRIYSAFDIRQQREAVRACDLRRRRTRVTSSWHHDCDSGDYWYEL